MTDQRILPLAGAALDRIQSAAVLSAQGPAAVSDLKQSCCLARDGP